jgi:hypothetical protein
MEHLSLDIEQQNQDQQVQRRRDKVQELWTKGYSQRERYHKYYKLGWLLSIETYHILGIKPKPTSKDTLTRGCQKNTRNVLLDLLQ